MPPRACLLGFAVAATMLVATAGCGGSSAKPKASSATNAAAGVQSAGTPTPAAPAEPSIPAGKPLTRAQLIARADAICRRLNHQAISIDPQRGLGAIAPELASDYRAAITDLRKLTPPAVLAADWKAMLADIQPLPEEIVSMGRYALDHDIESIHRIGLRTTGLQQHRFMIARRDGFTDCAEA